MRRRSLLLRLLPLPEAIARAFLRRLDDWRCWLLHDATKVRAPNRFDPNDYWWCDCGRRIGRRLPDRRFKGGYQPLGPPLDVGWLEGGGFQPMPKPPTASPAPRPRRGGLDYSDLAELAREANPGKREP